MLFFLVNNLVVEIPTYTGTHLHVLHALHPNSYRSNPLTTCPNYIYTHALHQSNPTISPITLLTIPDCLHPSLLPPLHPSFQIDLSTHEAEHSFAAATAHLDRLRSTTSARQVAKQIAATSAPYTVKIRVHRNGASADDRENTRLVVGSSIAGVSIYVCI